MMSRLFSFLQRIQSTVTIQEQTEHNQYTPFLYGFTLRSDRSGPDGKSTDSPRGHTHRSTGRGRERDSGAPRRHDAASTKRLKRTSCRVTSYSLKTTGNIWKCSVYVKIKLWLVLSDFLHSEIIFGIFKIVVNATANRSDSD